ncbi:diguanylate cyclase [Dyella flava]|uniref:diguanylate cyclase n=1 Tax=Dyella flava TaxID=1920170 RepID=A0ABS2K865_9GAMM|nr:diguanylate cyclase [Dyella flava]MBM7127381.1 GGDEF domain-containing protein [Dyella flava]
MHATGISRRSSWMAAILLSGFVGTASPAAAVPSDTAQLFARADAIKMVDNASYQKLIEQLERRSAVLSDTDQWHLRYLEAWQAAYVGQNDKARLQLEAVIKQSPDADLREQARGTLVNILGISHRYEEAFTTLDQALEELPGIVNNSTRQHVLAEASQLLTEAGQYDLAINYADQLILIPSALNYRCVGVSIKLDAEFYKGPHDDALVSQLQRGANDCLAADHTLSADVLRSDIASIEIEQGKNSKAITLLRDTYQDMSKLQYQWLEARYNVLLAEAYWKQNSTSQAEKYALSTVDAALQGNFVEPLSSAYQLLYQIAQQKGNLRDAVMYHEKFRIADDNRLDNIHEKALAYQVAKQQVEANKAEIIALNKQNKILELQQALEHKEVESSRLYIALLLTVLASIAFWLYRLNRSHLRFMRMARLDGLTGILNHQHFVEEAERSLRHAAKSMRCASLILIDLDHFKSINDKHGHTVGDQVLRRAVAACQRHLHSFDVFGRLGGEEFGILLSECSAESAIERAEQLRIAIHATPIDDFSPITISASLGIASTFHHSHDLRCLLVAADEALYQAKRDGRNRVVINIASYTTANGYAPTHYPANAPSDRESLKYVAEK